MRMVGGLLSGLVLVLPVLACAAAPAQSASRANPTPSPRPADAGTGKAAGEIRCTRAECAKLCEQAQPAACVDLSVYLQLDGDEKGAAAAAERSCSLGYEPGCLSVAFQHATGKWMPADAAATAEVDRRDLAVLDAHCKRGDRFACELAAEHYRDGRGTEANPDTMADRLEAACRLEPHACLRLAEPLADDNALRIRAAGLWEVGCSGGDALACDRLAREYEPRGTFDPDPKRAGSLRARAAALWEKACGPEDPLSCLDAAFAYEKGRATPPSAERPRQLRAQAQAEFEKQCRPGNPDGCFLFGHTLIDSDHGDDKARAFSLLRRACEYGTPAACWSVGTFLRPNALNGRTAQGALKIYGKQCDRNEAYGCLGLAAMSFSGADVPRDAKAAEAAAARAAPLFARECDKDGNAASCCRAGMLWAMGLGAPADLAKATERIERSLKLGGSCPVRQ